MICQTLDRLSDYAAMHPRFRDAEAFLKDLLAVPDLSLGRHDRDPKDPGALYANVQTYRTRPFSDGVFEAHRNYIDLQFVVDGEETICFPAGSGHKTLTERTPYQADGDYALFELPPEENCTRLVLRAGDFAVFFPGEAHAPGLQTAGGASDVRKIVVKIRCE